ncbi:CoA pyrophosphatase [Phenylobacterium sp.]|uniref:NUDIX hydrolase n=1 Tax=Phenylobacterium sp. TaxID=1871053 RepID=UPI0025F49389|nr:CoA pyrophosphatase [Phenylobacterium sp.]
MSPHQLAAPGARPLLEARLAERLDPLADRTLDEISSDFDFEPDPYFPPLESLTPAAVLVGLIERSHGFSVLLTTRLDTLRRHAGQVAFPGGRCDADETPWGTALREAEEEVGLAPGFVSPVGLSTPYRTGTGYLVTPVVAFIEDGFSLQPNPEEVADIFETPFAFLMDGANHETHERQLPDGGSRRFYAMTHEDRFIWGATAGMLRVLSHRLFGAPA